VKGAPGSVIPRFERQIANNQAITVTDFRMERYFISVEKASDFVMRVLDIMQNDHIYMLDVGEATNIYELAKKMRDDAGKHDLEIIETGILPGERLTEPYVIGNQAHVVDDIYLVK
jgi:FlaA1/EpsC-like NDP-sugar epimerase